MTRAPEIAAIMTAIIGPSIHGSGIPIREATTAPIAPMASA